MEESGGQRQPVKPGRQPELAIISWAQTPYRLHLHQRIASEIPELRLRSVFTCRVGDRPWNRVTDDIGPLSVSRSGEGQAGLVEQWRTGAELIRVLSTEPVVAAVVMGYAHLGMLRVIRWCRRRGMPCFL